MLLLSQPRKRLRDFNIFITVAYLSHKILHKAQLMLFLLCTVTILLIETKEKLWPRLFSYQYPTLD